MREKLRNDLWLVVSLQNRHKLQHFPLSLEVTKTIFDFHDEIIVASGLNSSRVLICIEVSFLSVAFRDGFVLSMGGHLIHFSREVYYLNFSRKSLLPEILALTDF